MIFNRPKKNSKNTRWFSVYSISFDKSTVETVKGLRESITPPLL